MKKFFTLSIVAIATLTLSSCNNKTNPDTETIVFEQEDARIRLAADQNDIASVDIMADGTYIAEITTDTQAYEGVPAYIHMPFERVPVNADNKVVTTYKRGNYNLTNNTYVCFDLCTIAVNEKDQFFFDVTLKDGNIVKSRAGILKATQNDGRSFNAVKAPGNWKPVKATVTYAKDNQAPETQDFDGCNLKEIATYLSDNGIDELTPHLNKFDGYNVANVAISAMNAVVIEFTDAASIGGYWDLKDKEASYSTKVDEKDLTVSATYKPAVSENNLTLNVEMNFASGKKNTGNYTEYTVNAKLSFTK